MGTSLLQQATAIEVATRIVRGGPKPRPQEREMLERQLSDAVTTLRLFAPAEGSIRALLKGVKP